MTKYKTLTPLTIRTLWFFLIWLLSLILFWPAFSELASLSFHNERYTHIALIPLISGYLVYLGRKKILPDAQYSPGVGIPLGLVGITVYYLVKQNAANRLSIQVFAIVLVWVAGFVLCYGKQSFSAAVFPASFLLLMIPLPAVWLNAAVVALQKGSTEVTEILFRLLGMPAFRQGFNFSLPGVEIVIAEQCSGIRSSIALLLASLLLGHIFLQTAWRKASLILLTIPLLIVKNAIRIVTIAWLGVYIDRGFLYGTLHRYSGLPISVLDLAILLVFLFILRAGAPQSQGARVSPSAI